MPPSTSIASSARTEADAKREAVLETAARRGFPGVLATAAATVRWLLCGRGRPVVFGEASYLVAVGEKGTFVLHPDIEASRVESEERLEERALIRAEWAETPNGRRAKVYSLTAAGRRHLAEQREEWAAFSGALAAILKVT